MRRVVITIGFVVMAGCGPNFDALFGEALPDAGSTPTPPVKDASEDAPPVPDDGGPGDPSDAGDAGCAARSCAPVLACDALGACTYSCPDCGCVCSAPCSALGTKSCTATCANGTICDASCNTGTGGLAPGTCIFAARGAKRAAYTCGANTGVCKATCDEGSDCSVTCYQLNTECSLACSDTAKCLLECSFSNNCKLECASGAAQTCLNGSKTCNRACP